MHCNALQRAATHCNVLQQSSTDASITTSICLRRNTVQRTATTLYNALQQAAVDVSTTTSIWWWRTAMHCNALQCTATHYNVLQHPTMYCNALQCTATPYNVLQRTTMYCMIAEQPSTAISTTTSICLIWRWLSSATVERCCSVWQCVAVRYSVLQWSTVDGGLQR